MAAPIGNNYNMKYKTPEERQALCKLVCDHLKEGYDQGTFKPCDWDTVERYIKDFPEDFPSEKVEQARRTGYLRLEKLGMLGMIGKLTGFNATVWIFMMKNKMGWRDKRDITSDGGKFDTGLSAIAALLQDAYNEPEEEEKKPNEDSS